MISKAMACPDCGSFNVNRAKIRGNDKPGKSRSHLTKPRKENTRYECIDCGLEFYEKEIRE